MDVILDTNILLGPLKAASAKVPARDFLKTNLFIELFTFLRRTKSELVIAQLVIDELCARYEDELNVAAKHASDAWTTLNIKAFANVPNYLSLSVSEEVEKLRTSILQPAKGVKTHILESYDNISLAEIVRRGVHRIP